MTMMAILLTLQIVDDDGDTTYLDVSDETSCNWMMFVRCASSFTDQNLSAFQKNGEIYFATSKVSSLITVGIIYIIISIL